MGNMQSKHKHSALIVPLQMLRGFAASFVVCEHFLERLAKRGALPHGLPAWAHDFGKVGVMAFFVISGFIMAYTTIGEFGAPRAGWRFFVRRIERIVPLYWITSLGMMIFSPLTSGYSTNSRYIGPTWQMVVLSSLFVPHISRDQIAQPVYGLGWTLEYEMFFYAVFAVTLVLPRRAGLLTAIGTLITIVGIGMLLVAPPPIVGKVVAFFYFTRPIMLYFVAGVLIAWWKVVRGTTRVSVPDWALGAVATIMLGAAVRWGIETSWLQSALTIGAIALVTLVAAGRGQPAAVTWLSRRFGDVSYSIYLTHSFLLGALALVAARLVGHGLPVVALVFAACLCCAVVAWPVWQFVERPMTNALKGR
jgi:exopolysaccharide production protein ExoZ